MTMQIFLQQKNPTERVPATGPYAELLQDMTLAARALLHSIERERTGMFDGIQGASFWIGRDPILDLTKKLRELADQRAASLNDGSFRR